MVDIVERPLGLDPSRVIDRRVYVEPDIFEEELRRIFHHTWQCVGHQSEWQEAGDYLTATIGRVPVVVTRGAGGELSAFYNVCTHRGSTLAPKRHGHCERTFICPYHGWAFDLEGTFVGAPKPEAYGPALTREQYSIPAVRVDTFGGLVFVSLDPDLAPLGEFLGEAGPYIERFAGNHEVLGRYRWRYQGNWKLWHENFRDNYHPEFTHQMVGTGYRGVEVRGDNFQLDPGHGLLSFPLQRDYTKIIDAMEEVSGLRVDVEHSSLWRRPPIPARVEEGMKIMAVFPNLDFQASLGGDVQNVVQIVRPVAVDQTVVELLALGVAGEERESREWRLQRTLDTQVSSGKISGDDTLVAERCQAGFGAIGAVAWSNMDRGQAPGKQGVKNDEYSLRSFYAEWRRYMGDASPW